jgi:hypothetical protein
MTKVLQLQQLSDQELEDYTPSWTSQVSIGTCHQADG